MCRDVQKQSWQVLVYSQMAWKKHVKWNYRFLPSNHCRSKEVDFIEVVPTIFCVTHRRTSGSERFSSGLLLILFACWIQLWCKLHASLHRAALNFWDDQFSHYLHYTFSLIKWHYGLRLNIVANPARLYVYINILLLTSRYMKSKPILLRGKRASGYPVLLNTM